MVGAEGLLGCGLDLRPRWTTVGVDPVVDLVMGCAVALCGPSVGGWAGKVPYTALCDGVRDGEEGVVDGGPISFGGDEDEGTLQVDAVK